MRLFESLVIFTTLLGLAWSFVPARRRARIILYLPLLIWALLIVHFIVEGARWQMVPAYLFAVGLTLNNLRIYLRKTPPRPAPKLVTFFMLLVFLVLFFVAYQLPVLVPVFKLPEPGGSYAVGSFTVTLTDPSREETFTPAAGDQREVPLHIWYPAEPAVKGRIDSYLGTHPEISRYLTAEMGVPVYLLDHLKLVKTHSIPNAPLATGQSSYPVVLFSHGYRLGYLEQNTALMEMLASHGYVVISLAHPYEAIAAPLTDGTLARYLDSTKNAFFDSKSVQEVSLKIWAADEIFVLDTLENLNPDSPLAFLSGHLDLQRLGIAGMSFGGSTAGQVCLSDTRCKAVLTLDSPQYAAVKAGALTQPLLMMVSDNGTYLERGVFEKAGGPAYLVTVKGTEHYNFSDLTLVSPLLAAMNYSGPINGQQMIKIMNAYTLAFFEKSLRGQPEPLLNGIMAEYPEVMIESRYNP